MNESRRSALKKLGLTTGAAWVAPAVSTLVVPQHATATSSTSCVPAPSDIAVADFYWVSGKVVLTLSSTTSLAGRSDVSVDINGGIDLTYEDSYSSNEYTFSATHAGADPIDGTSYNITVGCDTFADSSIYED